MTSTPLHHPDDDQERVLAEDQGDARAQEAAAHGAEDGDARLAQTEAASPADADVSAVRQAEPGTEDPGS